MKAIIHIALKPGVLDPQGKAVQETLGRMGFGSVSGARIGKLIELDLADGLSRSEAEEQVDRMCRELLANTVIESYSFEVMA